MSSSFKKVKEDFICEHCGIFVIGNGFTNHCPICLWSKHVDINPGDRVEDCGGMMKPIGAIKKGEDYIILHQCQKCGFERNQKLKNADNFNALLDISRVQ